MAQDPTGAALVFGGADGWLRRLDLATNATSDLLELPQQTCAYALAFSTDGSALGVCARPRFLPDSKRNDLRGFWSMWSYAKLAG